MQKKNYLFLNIAIIISIVFAVFIHFVICPLFLSLDLFGLQDATFESPLMTKYYLEFSFFAAFGILFICQMAMILLINIKTYKKTLKIETAKKKMKVLSIAFLTLIIIYAIGIIIINYLNENSSKLTCIMAFIPIVFYLIIGVYTIITSWLRVSNSELKDIEENTI